MTSRAHSKDILLQLQCLNLLFAGVKLRASARRFCFSDSARKTPLSSFVTLEIGTIIDHYRILSSLGAGGMGEVYLAEDIRLGRKVALKLLPASFVKNADRLRRFEQEARTASALNHPNIITIHDIGQSDSTHFIATEYIEGETLRGRLAAGPRLQLLEILDIAVQVAGALAAAHQAGIVHRDIKPENVMLRPDGYVKVLDFGIAKLTDKFNEQESTNTDSLDMEAPTLAVVQTEANVILGSPSYMSPNRRGAKSSTRGPTSSASA